MRILVVGDLCGDVIIPYGAVKQNLAMLSEGRGAKVPQVVFRHGGTCANTASVLAKLGDHPLFITDSCSDSNGLFLKKQLEGEGVDFSFCPVKEGTTMLCLAVMDENQEALIFPWLPPGSRYPTFSQESFDKRLFQKPYLLFIGGMVMQNDPASMDAVCTFAEKMKANGSIVAFDLNTRAETYGMNQQRMHAYLRMLQTCDILFGSGWKEFAPFTSQKTLQSAAAQLAEKIPVVIARDGSKPVLSFDHGNLNVIPVERTEPVSTIGAGDAFNAGYLHAYMQNRDSASCTSYACHIASWVISHKKHLSVPGQE